MFVSNIYLGFKLSPLHHSKRSITRTKNVPAEHSSGAMIFGYTVNMGLDLTQTVVCQNLDPLYLRTVWKVSDRHMDNKLLYS